MDNNQGFRKNAVVSVSDVTAILIPGNGSLPFDMSRFESDLPLPDIVGPSTSTSDFLFLK